jgi:hypothetical protein
LYQEIKQITTKTTTTMKIWITVAECMGTDGEFSSEVFISKSAQEAGEFETSLIADMIETMYMGDEEIDPWTVRELEGDGWFYRVRTEAHEI